MGKRLLLSLLSCCLLITVSACSKDDEADEKNKTADAQVVENSNEEKETSIAFDEITLATTLDELKEQKGGKYVENLSIKEELNSSADEFLTNKDIKNDLQELTKDTKNPVELQKGFIYLLGSPNYKEVIEAAVHFEPDFEDPYLPNPKKKRTETTVEAEMEDEKESAIILLDASSSMLLPSGNKIRMDIAKEAVAKFAEVLGIDADVSLVVYGHKGSESDADKELSCSSIEEIYPMGPYEKEEFEHALSSFESKGWTPLAGAIKKASEMTAGLEGKVTVYIVSDGVETCDGDPIQEAKAFVANHSDKSINIIGFQVDQEAENQLKAVAEAGNGEFYRAENAEDIRKTIENEWLELPSRLELAWAVVNKAPDGFEIFHENERYREIGNQIKEVIDKEYERFDMALSLIEEEQLLEEEILGELGQLIEERHKHLKELVVELEKIKIEEIDQKADEIRERVTKWKEEMTKLKNEQGDRF